MNKLIWKTLIGIFALAIGVLCYVNTSYFISGQKWKYDDGLYMGDWLDSSNHEIKERVLYTSRGNAKIVFCFGKHLILKDPKTKALGYYQNKNNQILR